ncbi:innexin inx2-like isoform X3 [Pseudomyrmex gracilis]|uniref:innexin inx2-like isoform X3 n=1 Tax=Pseudomyrmex gracilis TaxID=219809 RepID=UPI000995A13A|nr:innexin inx2-like isoform X3 [Pseudomyrmex gracilis]
MPLAARARSCRQCGVQTALARHRSFAARLHHSRNRQAIHRRADFLHDRQFYRQRTRECVLLDLQHVHGNPTSERCSRTRCSERRCRAGSSARRSPSSSILSVCFVLGLQAILFYVPRALWTIWERGTIGLLSRNLETPFLGEVWTAERKRQLVEYFTRTNLHSHNFYAIRFFVCELLNCLNSMGQIYALDVFLEGQFRRYGPLVSAFVAEKNPHDRIDPMARLFPKVTKCTIHTFGPAGSVQTHDALCVLPLNVVNEKIFVVLWFWLVFLACVGCLAVIYRYTGWCCIHVIVVFSQRWTRVYLLRGAVRVLERSKAECVVRVFHFGDWFLLYQLAQNVNPIVYRELVNEIAEAFARKSFADFV